MAMKQKLAIAPSPPPKDYIRLNIILVCSKAYNKLHYYWTKKNEDADLGARKTSRQNMVTS
jgi:hypothetical protein